VRQNSLFHHLLPPFKEGDRAKPRDMRLIAPEAPPWSLALSTAVQHVLVALTFLVYSLLAGQALGLEGRELRDFLALGILVMGFGTLINGLTTPLSAGHLLVRIPAPTILAVFIVVVETSGAGPAMGGVLAAACLVLLLGRFLPRLRVLFPAEITGIVVFLLGLSLIPLGMGRLALACRRSPPSSCFGPRRCWAPC